VDLLFEGAIQHCRLRPKKIFIFMKVVYTALPNWNAGIRSSDRWQGTCHSPPLFTHVGYLTQPVAGCKRFFVNYYATPSSTSREFGKSFTTQENRNFITEICSRTLKSSPLQNSKILILLMQTFATGIQD
jgi:hypothetical protein